MKKVFMILITVAMACVSAKAQQTEYPVFGAQVFVEPGQSPEQIGRFFSILKENGMTVARIRMFGAHIMKPDGSHDFTLYDAAFDAAERNGVRIFATLFPPTDELKDVGGFKFPSSTRHLEEIDEYIETVVRHYSSHPALYAWVIQNEPGGTSGKAPSNGWTESIRPDWKRIHGTWTRPDGWLEADFSEEEFARYAMLRYLSHIAETVQANEASPHFIHINPHGLMDNISEYDFAGLENILTSLGVSMHLSWHFDYFTEREYPDGVSIMCDIIRQRAGKNPFWVTELQGGNVTGSGKRPLCPTGAQTAQWLWNSIASGCEGILFWTLNPRMTALEAGEWAMLDYSFRPSDRLLTAAEVAKTVEARKELFSAATPVSGPVAVLYNDESFIIQKKNSDNPDRSNPGRDKSAVIRSAIGAYEALQSAGIQPDISCMDDFDWNPAVHCAAVIPNSVCIPERFYGKMRAYVEAGGHLIVTGLSGYFDEKMKCSFIGGHPLDDLFGAKLLEFKVAGRYFDLKLGKNTVKSHLWKGYLEPASAETLAEDSFGVTACSNRYGKGKVVWIPSPIELGEDTQALGELYSSLLPDAVSEWPAHLCRYSNPDISVRVMQTTDKYIYILTNSGDKTGKIKFSDARGKKIDCIFGHGKITSSGMRILPGGTEVFTVLK